MKNFTTKQEIRDLLNKVIMDEVSFTRMVEIMNERVNERVSERVSEAEDIPTKLKEGDLAIFWNFNAWTAMIGEYDYSLKDAHYPHKDRMGNIWANAIKFESKEQYERLIRGEI